MKYLVLFSDGGSRGNPGNAGYGYVIYEADSNLDTGDLIKDQKLWTVVKEAMVFWV